VPRARKVQEDPVADEKRNRSGLDNPFVRTDALQQFGVLVAELGGNPDTLCKSVGISPKVMSRRNAFVQYRSFVHLLEKAANSLGCPSFGLQLAERQGGLTVLGPLEIAMKNAKTVGDAMSYASEHMAAYSSAVQTRAEASAPRAPKLLRFDILLSRTPHHQQAVEHALFLTQLAILDLSEGGARGREIWFAHEPLSTPAVYRRHFGVDVKFSMPVNGILLNADDWQFKIQSRDERLYEMATRYIDEEFPETDHYLTPQVRAATAKLLVSGKCSASDVASSLGMHPRTLQRRLREEDTTFELIKDEVRRDKALYYLTERSLPLMKVTALLGYSEASVLTRSCYRWFSSSPKNLRRQLGAAEVKNVSR
jgi:AraC-like DNA-binding protein